MSQHETTRMTRDEYLSPPEYIRELGPFDTDPCAPIVLPWKIAETHYTVHDNGLLKVWKGRVWLNPPYGNETGKWLARLAEHGDGIALVFARTETAAWQRFVFGYATGILFIAGRVVFYNVDGTKVADKDGRVGNPGAPSALIAYGAGAWVKLCDSSIKGARVLLRHSTL